MTSSKLPTNEFSDGAAADRQRSDTNALSVSPSQPPVPASPQHRAGAQPHHPGDLPASRLDTRTGAGVERGAPAARPQATQRPASASSLAINASEERAEIARRIAAFRNLQTRLKKDREDYYDRMMARTRAVLTPEAKPKR